VEPQIFFKGVGSRFPDGWAAQLSTVRLKPMLGNRSIMTTNPPTSPADSKALARLAEVSTVPLLLGETPVTRIPGPLRVAATPGLQLCLSGREGIAIKRDDLTPGFGNKTRKLEVILADALAQGADCVLTAGGPQSNHCRQTAQFARELNLEAHLMFGTDSGQADFPHVGNQVIDRVFGARVHTCKKPERALAMQSLANELKEQGKHPYIIPVGGSNMLGVLAYARAFQEFLRQDAESGQVFERIVVGTSSGGTQAGLVVGAKLAGWSGEILGISIDQVPDAAEPDEPQRYVKHMVTIANEALESLETSLRLSSEDFRLSYDYLQGGYGVVGDYDRIGVLTLANHGLLAGPVYCGRAFGGLLDLTARGVIPEDGRTLFWHTGGVGELEFYKEDLFATA
jgi:D-cysteine desulfhydrase